MVTTVNDVKITPKPAYPVLPRISMQSDVGLRDILAMLWRRKAAILSTVMISTLLTAVILSLLTQTYSATTSIAMDRRGINIGDWEQVASGLPGDESTFMSEVEILRSRDLASTVVERLDLTNNPEFNKALNPSSEWLSSVRSNFTFLNKSANQRLSTDERRKIQKVATVNEFLKNLDVGKVGKSSRVMEIRFTSRDRELAALVSNTLAEAYLESQVDTKLAASQRANELLNNHVETLRQKVADSENAVEEYRRNSGLLKGKDVTFTTQKTAEVSSQLVLAEAAWAEAEARYRQIQSLMDSPGGADSAAQVLGSQLVKSLREQQSAIERNLAELSMEYGPRHPTIIKLKAERQDLDRTIQSEMDKIIQSYDNEVQIARARYQSMRRSLDKLERQVGQANSAEVALRSLEREARANQSMLESFLTRFKETSAQQDLGIFTPDATIISHAAVPIDPSFPNTTLFLALAVVASTFLGLLIVFLVENLDQGLRSAVDVEDGMGVPLLALVPALKGSRRSRSQPATYVAENSSSALAQSIRAVQTGITLSNIEPPPRTILVTSVQPREGKTTISACLARIRAMAGARVIVLDMDFHKPGIAEALGVEDEVGFADVLAGKASLQDVTGQDEASGASYITAGHATADSASLLDSENARRAIDILRKVYDTVIIDSPPLLAVSDARILAGIADATVLVARWGHTKRSVVDLGIRQILASQGRLAGIVLSQVDVRKNSKYGYPDSGAYSGALSYYYTN